MIPDKFDNLTKRLREIAEADQSNGQTINEAADALEAAWRYIFALTNNREIQAGYIERLEEELTRLREELAREREKGSPPKPDEGKEG